MELILSLQMNYFQIFFSIYIPIFKFFLKINFYLMSK